MPVWMEIVEGKCTGMQKNDIKGQYKMQKFACIEEVVICAQ